MKILKDISGVIAVLVGCFAAANASAITLDFSTLPNGSQGSTAVEFPEAVFSTPDGEDLFNFTASGSNGICATNSAGLCSADLEIDFTSPVENLSFSSEFYDIGDFAQVNIFDADDNPLGSINVNSAGLIDLASFGEIGRLFIDDGSFIDGFVYVDFTFDVAGGSPSAVPLPGALPLMASALLAGVFLRMWRRKRA